MDTKLRSVDSLDLDFRWRLQRQGPLNIEKKQYAPKDIINFLSPYISENRKDTIHKVVEKRTWDVVIGGDRLYDIGNINAVMRTAESFGFLQFKIFERQGSRYKKSDRISKGSEKWVDLEKTNDALGSLKAMKSQGYTVFASSLDGEAEDQHDLSVPLVMVLGNEKDGVSDEVLGIADKLIKIPMRGFTQSYNISVAGALLMQQIAFQRHAKLKDPYFKTEAEKESLLAQYYLRSVGDTKILKELESRAL